MLESFFGNQEVAERLRRGPLGPYLESAAASLVGVGYAVGTVRTFLWAAAGFGRWLTQNGLVASAVDERVIEAFLDERRRGGRLHRSQAAAIYHLLDHLRKEGVTSRPEPVGEVSPVDRLLGQYEDYLRVERGLTEATVVGYRPFVRGFLLEQFGDEPLRLRKTAPRNVTRFLLRQAQAFSHGRAQLMTTALRSLLRFLLQHGEIDVDLAASVLPVASRVRSAPVEVLSSDQIVSLLGACDRGSRTGCRDYAILLLLARLGLRAGEVVALELDDVDWRAGEITVPGKGLRRERLPLPADVGEALAAYVRRVRSTSTTRRVFLRMKAPCRGLADPSTVSTIVRRALERAAITSARRGAHLLRHSLATGMLRQGASMAEIGQILRHRSPSTTELYAKVDLDALRGLAQPWPGNGGER